MVISLEMVGLVFQRRGLAFGRRHRALREHKAMTLGFGLPAYLLCLVPVLQLLVIPAAVVGGTLLAHRVLEPVTSE
ncbi:EI24 domain-containing protein [Saccharopolyspora sp. ID03-671]|uniref:EI24 domain-containing protein n=1 Tax=Saccharopolyspora sp. ID03-671 TaxID=3073066 RepID=UPI00324B3636